MAEGIFHRRNGRIASLDRGNAAQSAGKYDHVHFVKVHFFHGNIRRNGDSMGAGNQLAADAHQFHQKSRPAEHITGCNGLDFFKALAQQ